MIRVTETPSTAQRDRIEHLLSDHAAAQDRPFIVTSLVFEDWDGEIYRGGLAARIVHGWMFVELLAVAPEARGTGTGTGRSLVEAAEADARARSLTGIWLDTYAFQAPDFYRALGYEEFGRLDPYPDGGYRAFFRKRL